MLEHSFNQLQEPDDQEIVMRGSLEEIDVEVSQFSEIDFDKMFPGATHNQLNCTTGKPV